MGTKANLKFATYVADRLRIECIACAQAKTIRKATEKQLMQIGSAKKRMQQYGNDARYEQEKKGEEDQLMQTGSAKKEYAIARRRYPHYTQGKKAHACTHITRTNTLIKRSAWTYAYAQMPFKAWTVKS